MKQLFFALILLMVPVIGYAQLIYQNGGNIGIGSQYPGTNLDVQGSIGIRTFGNYATNVGIGTSGSGSASCLCKQYSGGICISIGTCT